jgi:hypothetical protein
MKYTARSADLYMSSGREWFAMSNFYVCTKCFGLTSKGAGMQRCSCEKYKSYSEVDCPSGYHLCDICAASLAGGTSRYSWNACELCLKFNRKIGTDYGVNLPLGRHSIMNGIAIPFNISKEQQDGAIKQLLDSLDVSSSISDWGIFQARVLYKSVPMWKTESHILLSKWEAKFALTTVRATSRSVAAFKEYLEVSRIN